MAWWKQAMQAYSWIEIFLIGVVGLIEESNFFLNGILIGEK